MTALAWIWWAEWWRVVLAPEMPASASVTDLAQWRREHPKRGRVA